MARETRLCSPQSCDLVTHSGHLESATVLKYVCTYIYLQSVIIEHRTQSRGVCYV